MSNNMLLYMIYAIGGIFAFIVIAYLILAKKMNKSEYRQIQKLRQGTETSKFSTEVMYQKLYITYSKIPFLKAYILKLRRRLENRIDKPSTKDIELRFNRLQYEES